MAQVHYAFVQSHLFHITVFEFGREWGPAFAFGEGPTVCDHES
jgi:hypothetical protein